MNARPLFAASALVLAGAGAFAAESEQWVAATGSLTRAEVRAELARAQAAGEIAPIAVYGGFESARKATPKAAGTGTARSRDDVRAEGRAAARDNGLASLYVGG